MVRCQQLLIWLFSDVFFNLAAEGVGTSSSASSSGSSGLAPFGALVLRFGSTSSLEVPPELEGDLAIVVLAAEPDTVVLGEHGGISYIKGGSQPLFELDDDAPPDHTAEELAMQARLSEVLPNMVVDVSTPRDGHCLFHGLRTGGLCNDIDEPLEVNALRGMAVNMASAEQLTLAAMAQGGGMTSQTYSEKMRQGEYGDELMVALLAVVFDRQIAVITPTYARTYLPDHTDTQGVKDGSVVILHNGQNHYYGVIPRDAVVAAREANRRLRIRLAHPWFPKPLRASESRQRAGKQIKICSRCGGRGHRRDGGHCPLNSDEEGARPRPRWVGLSKSVKSRRGGKCLWRGARLLQPRAPWDPPLHQGGLTRQAGPQAD